MTIRKVFSVTILSLGVSLAASLQAESFNCESSSVAPNHYSSDSLVRVAQAGGTIVIRSSSQYYSTDSLVRIAQNVSNGGKLVLCVNDGYYSTDSLVRVANAGGLVVLHN